MRTRLSMLVLAAAVLSACADRSSTSPLSLNPASDPSALRSDDAAKHHGAPGAVFAETNSAGGNAVVAFARLADGTLSPLGTFPTGGLGSGGTVDPLASQYALVLAPSNRFLFAVNAGSNTITSFEVKQDGLTLVGTVPSGGVKPVSVAATENLLYVVNTASNTLAGFRIRHDGTLIPVSAWTRALSAGASDAAAVRFSRDGRVLVVAERTSRTIDSYVVRHDGSLGEVVTTASNGVTPFGFDFGTHGRLIVSEAGSNAASSYRVRGDASLALASGSVLTGPAGAVQNAPCWLIVTPDSRYAYTANAGSGTITGYTIAPNGGINRLTASGITGDVGAGSSPLDLDVSDDGRFLYVLEAGTGGITRFSVHHDGSLTRLGSTAGLTPRSGQMGLAAF